MYANKWTVVAICREILFYSRYTHTLYIMCIKRLLNDIIHLWRKGYNFINNSFRSNLKQNEICSKFESGFISIPYTFSYHKFLTLNKILSTLSAWFVYSWEHWENSESRRQLIVIYSVDIQHSLIGLHQKSVCVYVNVTE